MENKYEMKLWQKDYIEVYDMNTEELIKFGKEELIKAAIQFKEECNEKFNTENYVTKEDLNKKHKKTLAKFITNCCQDLHYNECNLNY